MNFVLQELTGFFGVHTRSSMWLRHCEREFRLFCQSHVVLMTSHCR